MVNKKITILSIALLILVALGLSMAFFLNKEKTDEFSEISEQEFCEIVSEGKWIQEHRECEGISQENCSLVGGQFNECASACRHDPEAQFCIMVCVAVCKL